MTDLVGVASNAVAAYQRALGTVSNNIANVATDGYSRQEVVLQASPINKVGNIFLGTGVMVDRVKRQYDSFVEANLRNSNSDLASQEPMVNYANRVIDVLGGQTMGLTSALDQFFSSSRDLATDPASSVVRSSFVRDAEGLASRFGQLSAQLDLVQEETQQALNSSVSQMNTLTKQLAQVNGQLTKQRTTAAQPSELLDQRDRLLKELSDFAHVNTRFSENGEVLVSLGPSFTRDVIVNGDKSFMIATNFNSASPEKVSLVLDPYGSPAPLTGITSGQLAGLMSFREQVLGSTRSAMDNLASVFTQQVNAIHRQGVDAYGNPGGDLFTLDPAASSVAGGMKVAFEDPLRIAAAAQFRVIEDPNNTGGADANVSYLAATKATGPDDLLKVLVNNSHPSAGHTLSVDASNPLLAVTTIANGMKDVVVYLDGAQTDQQLQLITRDGRQLTGQAIDSSLQTRLMTTANGFAQGASYSSSYLNQSGESGYKDMTVFYGAKADVRLQPMYDSKGVPIAPTPLAAELSGGRINFAAGEGVLAGKFTLNGVTLGALTPAAGQTLQASDVAGWINNAGVSGVTASYQNEIRIPASQLKLDKPLSLNGVVVIASDSGPLADAHALVDAINLKSATTKVNASLSKDGELLLTNIPGETGRDITLTATSYAGTAVNALGVTAQTFTGQVSITRALVNGQSTPVELGFGSTGSPKDLAKLGFRTAAYLSGTVKDDVMVFVTGAGTASVAASYSGQALNPQQAMRSQPMKLSFTSATHYTITDTKTNTVVAERDFDPSALNPGVSYQGLQLSFTSPPKAGDGFVMDGNVDGTGNNENMLQLAALERKALIGGSKTLGTAYIDQVNEMGNIARQATIAKAALTVVHEQAVSARDQVAGVSLDQEAADLIRFQQAYQAAAKVLQVASQLFDSVLQVR